MDHCIVRPLPIVLALALALSASALCAGALSAGALSAQTIVRVDMSSAGAEADAAPFTDRVGLDLSADGRFVAR